MASASSSARGAPVIRIADRITHAVVFAIGLLVGVLWLASAAWAAVLQCVGLRRARSSGEHANAEPPLPATYFDARWGAHGRIWANGVLHHYVAKGPEGAPLMICLHGFPECWYSWRYVLQAFSNKYRVVAVDLRGYGETSHSNASWWRAHDYGTDVLVQDVRDIITALGYRRAVVVAHDWGGQVGWLFAAAYSDMVEKLVILASPHPLLFRRNMTLSQALKSSYITLFQLPWLPEALLAQQNYRALHNALLGRKMGVRREGPLVANEEDVAVLRWVFSRAGTITAALNYYRAILTASAAYMRSVVVGLKRMRMPVLVLWGDQDGALSTQLCKGLDRVCTDVKLQVLSNCSHWIQQDAVEDSIAAMAEFLAVSKNELAKLE